MNMIFQIIKPPLFGVIKGRCYEFFAGKGLNSMVSISMELLAQKLITQ